MKITFAKPVSKLEGAVVALLDEGAKLPESLAALDKRSGGLVTRAIKAAKFEGKKDQSLDILSPAAGVDRLVLMGAGKAGALEPREIELMGGAVVGLLQTAKCKKGAVIALPSATKGQKAADVAALVASGAKLRHYAFDGYKSKKGNAVTFESLSIAVADIVATNKCFVRYAAIADGNHFARNLVNEPANILTPPEFAARAKALSKAGVKIEILSPAQMKKLGMGALLGVAQGSPHEARLVVMRWDGGKKGVRPVAFVGKGVTFDTGGVSIKPAGGMEDMKGDMAGAACVTGLMLALAKRKAKVNAIGAIGIVENAIDGKAQRPGDVVKSMSGQTIAVLNTDAEGRLVLADVLWYVQNRFKPQFMVNLATLTGAILVALGKEHAGLFSNNDELASRISTAGLATGEKVWRMPLTPEYDKMIDHDVADMKNIGGRHAGSITAAQFLQRFVNNVPWAHLDVAGTAMDSNKTSINQSWASGWGVRLLNNLVENHYEK
jgi:leucyl aminopeptidase